MIYTAVTIFLLGLCSALANNYKYPDGIVRHVTCDKGDTQAYVRIGAKYYFLGETKVSWFDAAHTCRRFGGDLALIETAEEMKMISDVLKLGHDANDWFWISGNDLVEVHKFASLTNGLPLAFTSWSVGQPDNPGVEQCVHLWLVDGEFRMNNWICKNKAYFICQRQNYTRCLDN